MKLIHTADWHLGHTLHGLTRAAEHEAFLVWLLELLRTEAPDALIIAGDVFDSACPPVSAERALFDLLAAAREALPNLDLVVVAGNHDSAIRLEAPAAILRRLNVHVVGSLQRRSGQPIDVERLLIPLHRADGEVGAWLAAVPYLRPIDLPPRSTLDLPEGADPLIEGVRAVYDEVLRAARERLTDDQALLATGHCYMSQTRLSELSERKILGGNQHALPIDIFPDDVAYVALGHLHKAQAVAGREEVRYSGSPIPLSMTERDYEHEVRVVTLDGPRLVQSEGRPIEHLVPLVRIPEGDPQPLEAILPTIAALDEAGETPSELLPFLEVRVVVDKPEPTLRRQVEEALAGKAARLVQLTVTNTGEEEALADTRSGARLSELDPRDVFRRRYRREHEGDPPELLQTAFDQLLEQVEREGSADLVLEPLLVLDGQSDAQSDDEAA